MNGNVVMKAKDTVFAALAECFVTIGTRRYNFMQAINLEAKFEKNKTEVPILGKTGKGNKASGWKGTGSATFHYNTSIFRQMMLQYKDCNIDGGVLAKFDADGEYLDEDMDFTFEDFKMPEAFKDLEGFLTN